MRNEGPFLLEWVAYHRSIGFGQIFVVSNDCTDGTDEMLDLLQDLDLLVHIRNDIRPGEAPQIAGMRLAMARQDVLDLDWLLHIDADEFLNITIGDGSIDNLVDIAGDADVMALLWRAFGHAGKGYWTGGSVLKQFTRTQAHPLRRSVGHKSMFRPSRFARAIDHMPKDPLDDRVALVNSRGDRVLSDALFHPKASRFRLKFSQCTWENACINHYAIKSQDVFLMKNDRGDGMSRQTQKYFLHSNFYRRNNQNGTEDTSILNRMPKMAPLYEKLLSNRRLSFLQGQALKSFEERRDKFLTPERIAACAVNN